MRIDTMKINLFLASQDLTKTEFATRSGVSRQSITAILGRGSCEPKTAGKLAKALGIDVQEIIKKED